MERFGHDVIWLHTIISTCISAVTSLINSRLISMEVSRQLIQYNSLDYLEQTARAENWDWSCRICIALGRYDGVQERRDTVMSD